MARDTGSVCKLCRREGEQLFLKGSRCYTPKCAVTTRPYPPGEHGRGRIRQSEYLLQLREKPSRQPGITGENLLRLLEMRLDNVVTRLAFASSRREARQLVRHGHFRVNGRKVDIPSYQVKPDDVISLRPESGSEPQIRQNTEMVSHLAPWLQADHDSLTGKILRFPERGEIDTPVREQLIVELYSK